ncbi:hypothetical protein Tco_0429676 [Tanacetum coccineum]
MKLHNVPVVAYSEVGLSLITSQLGRPIMLDAYTSTMCQKSWGRNDYARALIEVSSLIALKESIVVAIPFPNGSGHSLETVEVEYEWEPPRCDTCKIFDHMDDECPKKVKERVKVTAAPVEEDDGFTKVTRKQGKGKGKQDGKTRQVAGFINDEVDLMVLKNSFEKLREADKVLDIVQSDDLENNKDNNIYDEDGDDVKEVFVEKHRDKQTIESQKGPSTPITEGSRIILGWNPDIVNVVVISFDDQVMHTCVNFKADKKDLLCTSYVDTAMQDFQDCVEEIKVMDVNSSRLHFTWNQKPKGMNGLLNKIDRIMANLEFSSVFTGASAFFHPYRISNHTPAILRVPMHSTIRPLVKRLKLLKKPLRKLLYDHGNIFDTEEAAYLNAFNEASRVEERFLQQKAKVEWLKSGDANTAYFHKVVKSHASCNRIDSITLNNGDIVVDDQVPMAFIDHYTAFLGNKGATSVLNSNDLFRNQIPNEVAEHMIREVSDREIKDAIFSIGDDKSPGPDNYYVAFFKEAWDIIAHDVTNPMKINDYRPISCCNVLFKCITKIISNRMKDCLTGLVSLNQSAFIPGRRISDNILLTQELMHNYHLDRGPARCAFNVDIQKAYDTVDWDFLKDVLIGFGFHTRMIGWIMECVTSTLFFISINGGLHGYFKGKRGLSQGDLMSPYLFTLVMEILTLMLNKRAHESESFTYHRYCSKLNIINLCFADDLFLFAHGDASSTQVIMDALEEFKIASGLTPSLPKSTTYFCNVLNYVKLDILNILSFEEGNLPVKYLGVPLVPSRLIYRDCSELVEKVKQRIKDWKNNILSIKETLWVKWIHTYKLQVHSRWDIPLRGNMSWGWRKILQVRPLVQQFIWHRLGDGSKVFAWADNWCPLSPLSNSISNREIYKAGFLNTTKVKDIVSNGNWLWPNEWQLKLPSIFNLPVPHLDVHATDSLVWKDLNNVEGNFSVAVA